MKTLRQGLGDLVVEFHRANPESTDVDIAAALECTDSYVRATAKRRGIHLSSRKDRSASNVRCLTVRLEIWEGLQAHANCRRIPIRTLAERLLQTCINEDMVDAVLDDGAAA